eukprot:1143270-Pelagomonas_calceolata.AAC.1
MEGWMEHCSGMHPKVAARICGSSRGSKPVADVGCAAECSPFLIRTCCPDVGCAAGCTPF